MGYTQSLSRELGKNTGKWISNKVFGDSYATPTKLIIQRQREEVRQEKERAKAYKEEQAEERRAIRKAELEEKRAAKQQAEEEKRAIIEMNEEEVREHDNYLRVIQSVHQHYSEEIDWEAISNQPAPEKVLSPDREEIREYYRELTDTQINAKIDEFIQQKSQIERDSLVSKFYEPKFQWVFNLGEAKYTGVAFLIVAFLLFRVNLYLGLVIGVLLAVAYLLLKKGSRDMKAVSQLNTDIEKWEAKKTVWYDEYIQEHNDAFLAYARNRRAHEKLVGIAKKILAKDSEGYTEAIKLFDPLSDLTTYGSEFTYEVNENMLFVDFYVGSSDVIPVVTKRLSRNKLEVKEDVIPTSRYNEIYQDYVCSCVLRIGKEMFALLPIDLVLVNAKGMLLNTSTGKHEEHSIVSILLEREKLEGLMFNSLDPSDSMRNFKHNMAFKKTEGFSPVSQLTL